MRRVIRIVLHGLAAVSLGLSVAVAVLWARSPFRTDTVWWDDATGANNLTSAATLTFSRREGFGTEAGTYAWVTAPAGPRQRMVPPTTVLGRAGFEYFSAAFPGATRPGHDLSVSVPHWFLLAITLVAPTLWMMCWRRGRRAKADGRCRQCGYDLRASPERCPECGTIAAAKA